MMPLCGRGGAILVVDDEPDTLRFLTDALERAGYTVFVATSGHAALGQLAHGIPDLILMDAVMAGLDGFDTTARIKAVAPLVHIPVLFMTGLTGSEHVIRGFEVGGVDYVRKPINIDELIARVRLHMGNGRALQASQAGLDAAGRLMLATDGEGGLLWCTPLAERMIARLSPDWTRGATALPALLLSAVRRLLTMRDLPGACVRVEQPTCTLELSIIAHYRKNEVLIGLNDVDPEADTRKLQQALNVTHREAEVLLWVSYGKSSQVISDILRISPRTVDKHLERIFDKLGIESRSAAAAIAIRSVGR
jgi:DNA-binding NarL/FixJ family response regulator